MVDGTEEDHAPRPTEMAEPDHGVEARRSGEQMRDAIYSAGWGHGTMLADKLHDAVVMRPGARAQTPNDRYVIVSQDCDVVCRDFDAEPTVEVLRVRPAEKRVDDRLHLRNPRVLQFEITTANGGLLVEAWARDRGDIDRTLLKHHAPDQTAAVPDTTRVEVAAWLRRRYDRTAFPDEFTRRLEDRRKALRKFQKAAGNDLVGIFVRVDPHEELGPDAAYRVILRVIVRRANLREDAARSAFVDKVFNPLVNSLGALDGIKLIKPIWQFDDQFTYADVEELDLLDFDFDLSYSG